MTDIDTATAAGDVPWYVDTPWIWLAPDFTRLARGLSNAAVCLHVDALCWSSKNHLDLRIPKSDMPRLGHPACAADRPAAVNELLSLGWWTDTGTTYTIARRQGPGPEDEV